MIERIYKRFIKHLRELYNPATPSKPKAVEIEGNRRQRRAMGRNLKKQGYTRIK